MPARGASVAPGDLVDGRYLLESLIGSGGMAVVYQARHTGTGAACALKLVHPHLVARRDLRELFLREAQVGGRIGKNPHIVDVLDAGFDAERGQPYLAMELLSGETLEDLAAREGALPPALVVVILEQIADALDQAHAAGVVHRDLKPGNLFLVPGRRGEPWVKVMDFGIAKVIEAGAQATATQIGTPAYAAPEQMGPAIRSAAARQGVAVAAQVSPATDVWALGLLAYELCTGLPAMQFWGAETSAEVPIRAVLFPHDPASAKAGERAALLPRGFDEWLARATDVDASRRWPAAGVAVAELVSLWDDEGAARAAPVILDTGPVSVPSAYGPGTTEFTGTPVPLALAGATVGAWAGRTPPPASASPAVTAAKEAPWAERPRFPRAVLVACALLAVVGLGGAAAAVLVGPPPVRPPSAVCRASGERCPEACDAGDAWSCGRLAARLERGEGVARDEVRAAALYGRACDGGDAFGCAGLGRLYRRGAGGLVRDDPRALTLFRSACARGDASGCKDLGGMYQYGRGGLARDDAQAAAHYRQACDGGDLLGCNDLGVLVGAGRGGLARDDAQAADLYRRACDGGEMLGCDNLAWMFEHGKGGLPVDAARAAALYRRACDAGDARGCGNLAVLVERGTGGFTADPARAATLYQQACDRGDAHACDNLGSMVESARGGLRRDDARAATLYGSACDAGDMDGCNDLAHLLEEGRGVARDDSRAVSLYERACEGSTLRACVNLGVLLAAGRGAPRDERRAVTLWERACDGGLSGGCADLGWATFLGHGIARDPTRGLSLLRRACTAGSAFGCDRLDEAEGRRPRSSQPAAPSRR